MPTNIFFQTEGTNPNGEHYESAMCMLLTDEKRRFAHALLDEFLDAFSRDPKMATLSFMACTNHTHSAEE